MKYELFNQLYAEALEYSDVELYIAERGWQEWMDDCEDPGETLNSIYSLANSSLKEIRESKGISRAAFSRMYNIPIRSLENWDSGSREAPDYIKPLIAYTLIEGK